MARSNIFELLKSKWNIKEELVRLDRLFEDDSIILKGQTEYTLRDFVADNCFEGWKNSGRYIDVDDYLEALDFDVHYSRATYDIESFLIFIEVIYNFFYMARVKIMADNMCKYYTGFIILEDNMNMCLEHYNYSAIYLEDKEQVIVSEKDPATTAVAEISDPETAYQIIKYNHYSLKGDILAKKRILLHLDSDLAPKRSTLSGINKTLSDGIFTLMNNLNLRHPNCDPQSKDYKQYTAEMSKETLEEWYDELYQMILLAKLELDHLERKNKIAELKTHFENREMY